MNQRVAIIFRSLLIVLLLASMPVMAFAWPAEDQWFPLVQGGTAIQDVESDANGGVNVVPNDGSNPAAYIYNDGAYLYYRLRLDADPTQGGNGIFAQFGWGFEIDIDQNADDYEWLIMCDGISSPEVISLRENTDKTGIGDPSDKAEYVAAEYPLVGNHRLTLIQPGARDYTFVNGDDDYYLDYRLPYDVFKSVTGITDNTIVRYFAGSSRSTNNLTDNGADLVGGSDLYEMGSDFITPFGDLPDNLTFFNGTVQYVEDIGGFGDIAVAAPGDTLFIRVDDADLNSQSNPLGTVRVLLTAPSGDEEIVLLTATGVAGKYTGSILSEDANDTPRDGVLQVSPDETITVQFIDAIAADRSQSVVRTDTILFTATGLDLSVSKVVDIAIPSEDDTVTFTVSVTNHGPAVANGVQVNDALPAGLTLVTSAPSQGTYVGGVWDIGTLNRYNSATLTLVATVDAGTNGTTLTNTAILATSTPVDSNPANDSASAAVSVGGTDLRVTKTASTLYPAPGAAIVFTIRVFNLGPTDSAGIQVSDLLPVGDFTYQSHSVTQGSYASGTGLWDVGSLTVGTGAILTLNATANGAPGDTISNTASLTASDQPDTDPSNDSATVALLLDGLDIAVTKIVDQPAPTSGSSIIYTLTATNNGPNQATNLQLTDLLPAELSFTSASGDGTYTSGTGLWDIGTLDSGSTATLSIQASVLVGFAGETVLNSVILDTLTLDQPDIDSSNDRAEVIIQIDGTDLSLTKAVLTDPTPGEGDLVTFRLEVTNNGPTTATNLNVTDILPAGLSHTGNGGSAVYRTNTGNNTFDKDGLWEIGTLAISATAWLEIDVEVDSGTSGQNITNVAFITEVDQEDPLPGDNTASATVSIDGIDLALVKSVDNATPNVGDQVTYTLTLSNNSPTATATGIEITDLLPPEVIYISDNGAGSYVTASGVWSVASLAPATSTTLNIVVEVRNEDSHLVITNTATITAADQGDPDTSNNSDFADVTVNASDLSVVKTITSAAPYIKGSTISYLVTVTNSGANPVTGVEVEDILSGNLLSPTTSVSQGSYSAGLWFVGALAGGANATLTIDATINPFMAGDLSNTATLTQLDQIDTDSTNDSSTVTVTPLDLPVITVVKSADRATVNSGDFITYTIVVQNSGSGAATNVQVSDDLSPFVDMILDFDTGTPPVEAFDFDPQASGLTLGAPLYTYSGPDIIRWEITMGGSFATNSQFSLRFKVQVK